MTLIDEIVAKATVVIAGRAVVTLEAAAAKLGCSTASLHRRVKESKLTKIKAFNRTWITVESLDQLCALPPLRPGPKKDAT